MSFGALSKELGRKSLSFVLILLLVSGISIAAPQLIDGFEDGDLSEWTSEPTFQASTDYAYKGDWALQNTNPVSGGSDVISRPINDGTTNTLSYRISLNGTSAGQNAQIETQNGNGDTVSRIKADSGDILDYNDNLVLSSYPTKNWMLFKYTYDYSSNTYDLKIKDESGTTLATVADKPMVTSSSDIGTIEAGASGADNYYYYMDEIGVNGYSVDRYEVSGRVSDTEGNDLSGVTVKAVNSKEGNVVTQDTTDNVGKYSLGLQNGTYDITASKNGYLNDTATLTVDGSGVTQDFELEELNQNIRIDTRSYLEHGRESTYRVTIENSTGTYNVSQAATVTSNDTSVVTVDSGRLKIIATNDTSVNKRTYIEATYTDGDGNSYSTTQNVTVANQTVKNIGILPTGPQLGASLGDQTIQVILVATMLGAAVGFVSRSFAGLGTMTLVMTLGWLGGLVGNGMVIISVLIAMFIGLNIAANIDYTVAR